jgi:hypothetical protein
MDWNASVNTPGAAAGLCPLDPGDHAFQRHGLIPQLVRNAKAETDLV